MAPYYRPVTSRCYVSTFRAICDSFREVLSAEVENTLRTVHIHQFLFFPAFQQNIPLMYELLKCWDSTEEGFKIKDQLLKFSTDEVAILTGLPNTGVEIIWHNEPLGGILSIELKSEMTQLSRSTDDATVLKTFISFVVSNLFFPLNSLKTPRRLVSIANSLEEFSSINWAWTLREFMVNEFNRMATKLATEKPLDYINGFIPLLLVWFLEHIVYVLDGLSAEEADLVHADLTSFQPPPSPLKQKSHEPSDLPPAKKIRIKTSQTSEKQKSPEHELPHESKEEFQSAQAFAQPEWLSHLEERMHNWFDAASSKIQKAIGDRIDKIEANLQIVEGKVDDLHYKFINHCLQCPVDSERTTAESSSPTTESSHETVEQPLAKWKRLRKFTPTTMDEQPPTTTEQEATPLGDESSPIPMDEQPPTTIEQEATRLGDESPPITTMQAPPSPTTKEQSPFTSTIEQSPTTKGKEIVPTEEMQYPTTTGKEIVPTEETQSPTTGKEIVTVSSQTIQDIRSPAKTEMDYPGKIFLAPDMQSFMDDCFKKYAYRQDVVFSSGHVILTRRDINHILLDECLDNFHVDTSAFFLDRKTKALPAIYQPYLYISPMHRILKTYNDYTDLYVKHIKKETLKRSNLLIMPIINNNHWTLLVGRLKERVWKLYDSLPNPQHKEICVTVVKILLFFDHVNELYNDMIKCFEADITKWRINIVRGNPTQSNSFDCGMFVCKYMEKVVLKDKVDWSAYKYWQNEMPRYRADFAYQILLEGERIELNNVKKRIESAAKAH
ncbi:hypothetical protein M5K25_002707 [Dendrobium thyrsiflorum]|uniref:Ubiquitin-like protease family profile domain-containing protein n=1 Tax=Dendrobium thyrsiflorum TaxID=117978 RepID=A0ABD0VW06_DENTH